jgi:dienelactone hydrolase
MRPSPTSTPFISSQSGMHATRHSLASLRLDERVALVTVACTNRFGALLLWLVCCFAPLSQAQEAGAAPGLAEGLTEEVTFLTRSLPLHDAQLETTLFRPAGDPPWPLVVLNHGALGVGNPHGQPRYRPLELAAFFVRRGYLVAAPMRQGFSNSTGSYRWDCDHERYAERYGGDIAAVIDGLIGRGLARVDQVVVVGQSNGGMVVLGYAAESASSRPLARGFINFSGGINSSRPECDWRDGMVAAARSLGARTRIPSLWLYTRNDTIFPPDISQPFFDAYHSVQPHSTFVLYDSGGHGVSNSRQGGSLWGADVDRFLGEIGLPAAAGAASRKDN